MKRQWDERHETMRFALQLAQLDEVVDALFFRFHVPVKHRRVRTQPDFMRLPRNIEPHLPAHFVIADNPAHAWMKNLRPASRQRIDPRFFQLEKSFLSRHLPDAPKVAYPDHPEPLQLHTPPALPQ